MQDDERDEAIRHLRDVVTEFPGTTVVVRSDAILTVLAFVQKLQERVTFAENLADSLRKGDAEACDIEDEIGAQLKEVPGMLAKLKDRVAELEAGQLIAHYAINNMLLREALTFYAEPSNYEHPCSPDCCDVEPLVFVDGGDRARAALSQTKKT